MTLIDGQIYRWRWADSARHDDHGPYRSYHCKSQIAVVRDGRLYDTYWSTPSYEHEIDPAKVILTPYADEAWQTISEYDVPYYDEADVASMRHPNNSRAPIYLRPGAVRSQAAILAEIKYREETAEGAIRSAQSQLEWLAEARKAATEGRLDEVRL